VRRGDTSGEADVRSGPKDKLKRRSAPTGWTSVEAFRKLQRVRRGREGRGIRITFRSDYDPIASRST